MKLSSCLSLACLLATGGCLSNLPLNMGGRSAADDPPAATSAPAGKPAKAVSAGVASGDPAVAPAANAAAPSRTATTGPEPDAIIKLNPGSDRLSPEMEARLVDIARKSREDERIMLRLQSYVPDRGSPSLNLVRAEQSLQLVRKRLVDLDVSPRRIVLAPFGAEYETARDERRHWVEIYLIKQRL